MGAYVVPKYNGAKFDALVLKNSHFITVASVEVSQHLMAYLLVTIIQCTSINAGMLTFSPNTLLTNIIVEVVYT
jgi:hypothetical protein